MAVRMSPDERDAILVDLKQWPLMSYDSIAAKFSRSKATIHRLALAWDLGRRGK